MQMVEKTSFEDLKLRPNQKKAVLELKEQLTQLYPIQELTLFGSVARQEANEDSDIDVLVLTKEKITHKTQGEMSEIVFDIDIKHDTCISIMVFDNELWNNELSFTWLYQEIQRDGIPI